MSISLKGGGIKKLGSLDRSGGYSRRIVLNTVRDFVRPNWLILMAMMLLPGVVGYIASLFPEGSQKFRWLYLGAFGISGIWLVIIFVIIWTGIGNPLMGLDGENRTAVILRKSQRHGWQLVNGLRLDGDWDIDHVLIGPAGILIFESKWSHKLWPVNDHGNTFMAGRLEDAVRQVNRNCAQFKSFFKKELVGTTVTPVCVLWSNSYGSDSPESFQTDGVVVVPGPALESWMESLNANWLDSKKIEHLSSVLAVQVAIRDRQDSEKPDQPLPTLGTLFQRNILEPLLGFSIVLYGFEFLTRHRSLWFSGSAFVLCIAIGYLLTKKEVSRRFGQGWLGACFACFCALVVALIQVFTR